MSEVSSTNPQDFAGTGLSHDRFHADDVLQNKEYARNERCNSHYCEALCFIVFGLQ